MRAIFRPIDVWPGEATPAHRRKSRSTFRGKYEDTLELLERELEYLGAKELVIQCRVSESDIRMDGYLRATARPADPGIIVAFDSNFGPLKYSTDVFDHWQANLRAIALGLEKLRAIDRYGITKRGEQYTGWQELGSGIPMPDPEMTVDEAAQFINHGNKGPWRAVITNTALRESCYKSRAKRLHPDMEGGDKALFQKLQTAKRVLDQWDTK